MTGKQNKRILTKRCEFEVRIEWLGKKREKSENCCTKI